MPVLLFAVSFQIATAAEPTMCTMQYAPVCGQSQDGTAKTYGNSCMLGADQATLLYEGECKTETTPVPQQDLWAGMRSEDVVWLQQHLISQKAGASAQALAAVGATGYFGPLTRAALAEYQAARGITPAVGYFGPKTRASVEADLGTKPQAAVTFTGKISAVDTSCFFDGVCSITVDGKKVIVASGMRISPPPLGTLKGVESIGDVEKEIGSTAKVYAAPASQEGYDYTLYGSTDYYLQVQ
ncbi:MAG: hypothetical protein JWL87_481 [Candidatus Adlerbacteria bacterium]|nr:hypothetical protein [Candidatus Adlerbacteria bacterium]